jgi:hypothetical protein
VVSLSQHSPLDSSSFFLLSLTPSHDSDPRLHVIFSLGRSRISMSCFTPPTLGATCIEHGDSARQRERSQDRGMTHVCHSRCTSKGRGAHACQGARRRISR